MIAVTKFIKNQRGDTLVEVMLATVIMSVVVSASFALVNRASRINQVSSERSDAVNAMQTQAEVLRLHRNASNVTTTWDQIVGSVNVNGTPASNNCSEFLGGASSSLGGAARFYFDDAQTQQIFNSSLTSGGNIDRYYVWIEGYRSTAAPNNDYVDFYVHSCWLGPGGTGPQQASLIYRLAI